MTQIKVKVKRRCRKSRQAMISRPRLPFVVGGGILEVLGALPAKATSGREFARDDKTSSSWGTAA